MTHVRTCRTCGERWNHYDHCDCCTCTRCEGTEELVGCERCSKDTPPRTPLEGYGFLCGDCTSQIQVDIALEKWS